MSQADVVEAEALEVTEVDTSTSQTHLPAVREHSALATADELSVEDIVAMVEKVRQVQERVMREGEHYGVIPGTDKPTLLQPGAQKLTSVFRLRPKFEDEKVWHPDGHLDVTAYCTLVHISTGVAWVERSPGFCSSRESRYAFRKAKRTCPACGAEAITKAKDFENTGVDQGWFCWRKEGGCGQKYPAGSDAARAIEAQPTGKVANENLPDVYNTVIKMAAKRALVGATLAATAASDVFTQDVEDGADPEPALPPDASGSATPPSIAELEAKLTAIRVELGYSKDSAVRNLAANRERFGGELPREWLEERIAVGSAELRRRRSPAGRPVGGRR